MSRRGRRVQKPRGPHTDKYAREAARSQAELAAFNAQWERDNPAPSPNGNPNAAADTLEDEEDA